MSNISTISSPLCLGVPAVILLEAVGEVMSTCLTDSEGNSREERESYSEYRHKLLWQDAVMCLILKSVFVKTYILFFILLVIISILMITYSS